MFPASHPYVLAAGGTSLRRDGERLHETAWRGSGGGLSRVYPAPAWQMTGDPMRAMADVALNADPGSGYQVYYRGAWHMIGGTSVSAPIWGALVALVNQARAAAGRAPLGLAAPEFCEVGLATDFAAPAFIDITAGDNGAYGAAPGFDLPTGWGVPQADVLARALAEWTPPPDGRGGITELVTLTPTSAGADSSARLRFRRRCLSTSIDLHVRQFPPGAYVVEVDGAPVASFSPDARGGAMLALPGVDVRGRRVSIRREGDAVLFVNGPAPPPPDGDREIDAMLINTGMAPAASGSVEYRASGGRDELTIRAGGLPTGRYDVRLGGETIGTLVAASGSAVARFDSRGMTGQPLRTTPLCKPIIVARDGKAYLRSAMDVLAPGECRGDS
jgi:hypothetical protein